MIQKKNCWNVEEKCCVSNISIVSFPDVYLITDSWTKVSHEIFDPYSRQFSLSHNVLVDIIPFEAES